MPYKPTNIQPSWFWVFNPWSIILYKYFCLFFISLRYHQTMGKLGILKSIVRDESIPWLMQATPNKERNMNEEWKEKTWDTDVRRGSLGDLRANSSKWCCELLVYDLKEKANLFRNLIPARKQITSTSNHLSMCTARNNFQHTNRQHITEEHRCWNCTAEIAQRPKDFGSGMNQNRDPNCRWEEITTVAFRWLPPIQRGNSLSTFPQRQVSDLVHRLQTFSKTN